ncbi:MAG: helix-turn-helix transcriptional regulator [Actinobacteria bacterium]|nr:helix-turn-helix transcriptional regulator [Actinomycetota bacterium]
MSSGDLTFISYSVLVLVGRGGASAHDLVQMMRDGPIYHAAAPSQYYAEPKRLERLGLLESSREPGRTRERTVYRLTDAGVEALREWMAEPTPLPRVPGEPHVRALAADLVGEKPVRESLLAMRAEIAEQRARLDEAEERAKTIPHREKYLLLTHGLARRFLAAYDDWLDEVERELA